MRAIVRRGFVIINVEIRSVVRPDFLHGKLYFIERNSGEVQRAISGSSNFTVNGLGLKPSNDDKAYQRQLRVELGCGRHQR